MGEVANIVGGNVKSLLPRGVDHTIPGRGGNTLPPGNPVLTAVFSCTAGPLWVSLIEDPPAG